MPHVWRLLVCLVMCLYGLSPSVVQGMQGMKGSDHHHHGKPILIEPKEMKIFKDYHSGLSDSYYYRYFKPSVAEGKLYVGAADYVYRLDLNDITMFERSEAMKASEKDVHHCLTFVGNLENYHCVNHIRSILMTDDYLFVCGTGGTNPTEYHLNKQSLKIEWSNNGPSSGVNLKCPTDPERRVVSLNVPHGNPGESPAMYFGVDEAISRPKISEHIGWIHTKFSWRQEVLNNSQFIFAHDHPKYVYFFFRENAQERSNCGKEVFSRVARVCKEDYGGNGQYARHWTSLVKARLNCSIGGHNPFYFNYLREMRYVNKQFIGLFTTPMSAFPASAVCAYKIEDVDAAFDEGSYYYRESFDHVWRAEKSTLLDHRPGECVKDSPNLSDTYQQWTFVRPLSTHTIQSNGPPLYTEHDHLYHHMEIQQYVNHYMVLFLATHEGVIHKVVLDRYGGVNGNPRSKMVNEWAVPRPIFQLFIYDRWLYVGQDHQVIQFAVSQCGSYDACTHCIMDPHCGWHNTFSKCVEYVRFDPDKLIQDVFTENPLKSCDGYCRGIKHKIITEVSRRDAAVQLTCNTTCPPCPPHLTIAWFYFHDGKYEQLVFNSLTTSAKVVDGAGMHLLHDGGLLLKGMEQDYISLRCQIGGVTQSDHVVRVQGMMYHDPGLEGNAAKGIEAAGWKKYEDHTYKFFANNKVKASEAHEECQRQGALLLSINDMNEDEFIRERLLRNVKLSAFIGGGDKNKGGEWRWEDGTKMPVPDDSWHAWRTGQPDHLEGEHCTILMKEEALVERYSWLDYSCRDNDEEVDGYICEGSALCEDLKCKEKCYYVGADSTDGMEAVCDCNQVNRRCERPRHAHLAWDDSSSGHDVSAGVVVKVGWLGCVVLWVYYII